MVSQIELPINEAAPVKKATSPYGNTKQIGEEILQDTCAVSNLKSIALRYFNPIGAHDTSEIGELALRSTSKFSSIYYTNCSGLRREELIYFRR